MANPANSTLATTLEPMGGDSPSCNFPHLSSSAASDVAAVPLSRLTLPMHRRDVRAIATLPSHAGESKLAGNAIESGHLDSEMITVTNVQKSRLRGSDTSNLSPSTPAMASLKPNQNLSKRESDDDICRGTYKKSRANSIDNGVIEADSQSDGSITEKLMKDMSKMKENITRRRKRVEFAPQGIMSALLTWKGFVSTIAAQKPTGHFDKVSSDAFFELDKSIGDFISRTSNLDLQSNIVEFRKVCEDASCRHLREGKFDENEFIAWIDRISEIAKLVTGDDKESNTTLATEPELTPMLSRNSPRDNDVANISWLDLGQNMGADTASTKWTIDPDNNMMSAFGNETSIRDIYNIGEEGGAFRNHITHRPWNSSTTVASGYLYTNDLNNSFNENRPMVRQPLKYRCLIPSTNEQRMNEDSHGGSNS